MANIKPHDENRCAMAIPLIVMVSLACTWMHSGALAQNACGSLNYDESKVGDYTIPDPLLSKDGKRITDAASWMNNRRNEILRDFRDVMYGHTPEMAVKL